LLIDLKSPDDMHRATMLTQGQRGSRFCIRATDRERARATAGTLSAASAFCTLLRPELGPDGLAVNRRGKEASSRADVII
jgi:hypothetical protein